MLEESVLFQKQMEEGKVCYGIDFLKKSNLDLLMKCEKMVKLFAIS